MRKALLFMLSIVPFFLVTCWTPLAAKDERITVFAAASLTDVLGELSSRFTESTGISVDTNLASSGILAKQIIAGAPADVYLSANTAWMSEVVKSGCARAENVINFAGNRLVVIIREDAALDIDSFEDLVSQDVYTIAIGDPASVPAGQYAMEALKAEGIYDRISSELVPAVDVRAVVAYVANREADAGIVYRTDALATEGIYIAAEIPETSHSPIVYQATALGNPVSSPAQRFLDFLTSAEGREILNKYGFITESR
jgi:molybdate transport system substrate-binding protein